MEKPKTSRNKFCSGCSSAREEGARFCHQCGLAFNNPFEFWVVAFMVVALSGLVFLYADRYYNPHVEGVSDHDHAGHDHAHEPHDNGRMQALKRSAQGDNAVDLLNLAEYQIESSSDQPIYLRQAAESLERLVAKHPDHAYSLRLLGNIYFQLKDPEAAAKHYLRYLRLVPSDANALTDLGTQYLALGQVETAIESYNHALKLYPDLYHAQFNLSVAYTELGDEAQAQAARDAANAIERRVGKVMAPIPEVTRLPEGGATPQPAGPFDGLRDYFAGHPIIGPKMVDFSYENNHAVLVLNNFPMEQMPPFAREKFDTNVKAQLAPLTGAELTIRDAAGDKVLATYRN